MPQHEVPSPNGPADPKQRPRIITTEGICGGRPRICGTRVRVLDVLDMLASGMTEAEIVRDYPFIIAEDIGACLKYVRRFADLPLRGLNSCRTSKPCPADRAHRRRIPLGRARVMAQ